nr:MAG TPA: hypothetical protein [Caudoviricetes sp.]
MLLACLDILHFSRVNKLLFAIYLDHEPDRIV